MCRREGLKLFLKGERCYTDKCAIERRNYPPGAHGQARTRFSEFSIRLREKQKVKRIYGLLERQFSRYFEMAERMPGRTGENLLVLLERRLDNVFYRLGFASSLTQARQLIRHGHFEVGGRKVTIPSYLVSVNEPVVVTEKSRQKKVIQEAIEMAQRRGCRVADHLEGCSLDETERYDDFIDWFLDAGVRLRRALDGVTVS